MKTPARPPAFAFISFDDHRDAQDAIRGRDGYNFDGYRLRCEFAKGDRGRGELLKVNSICSNCISCIPTFASNDRKIMFEIVSTYSKLKFTPLFLVRLQLNTGGGRLDEMDRPRAGGGAKRRTDYGVKVSNLPKGCSWQDLKDFMRKAGDVVYTDVDRSGDGVVEFGNRDDMEYAVRTFDDTEFKHFNESTYIRVKLAKGGRDSRGRSASRSPKRSNSRSPKRSVSRSPKRSVSRSRSR